MNELLIKGNVNGITCEEYHGHIPDKYRTDNFGPITDLELPDIKINDEKFNQWLDTYRDFPVSYEQSMWTIWLNE